MAAETTALDAAKYLITLDDQEEEGTSNLKLQKLLYYGQGLHLALHNAPLFGDRIEAWGHGPVCPTVYHAFKGHGASPLPLPASDEFDPTSVPPRARETLDEVHTVYGQFSAWRLREMTHEEDPWKNNYREGDRGILIPHGDLRAFFLGRLRG